jgi:hypothetical protein
LGLFAFGLTTALLQVKHTRIGGDEKEDLAGVETLVLGFAMFFGGLLQIIAGISEIKRNNIFGYTAFLVYGGFWMSVATVDIIKIIAASDDHPVAANPKASQAMLFLVGVISTIFWICTFKLNKTICVLFGSLTVTVFLLVGGVRNETVDQVAGYSGLITAALAYWLAFAELMNDIHGEGKKEIIPLGHFKPGVFQHGGMQVQGRIQPNVQHSNRHLFFSRRHLLNGHAKTPTISEEPDSDLEAQA